MKNWPNTKREIRWAELSPARGHEQATYVRIDFKSRHFNERSETVIAVAITSQSTKTGFPITLKLETGNLPKQSWVKTGQIRTLSRKRIGKTYRKVLTRISTSYRGIERNHLVISDTE